MALKAERKIVKKTELKKAFQQLKGQLKKEHIQVREIILFGSYASGTAHRDSDIDVALLVPTTLTTDQRKKLSKARVIAKNIHVKFEPHILSNAEYRNRWIPLASEVRKYGKVM